MNKHIQFKDKIFNYPKNNQKQFVSKSPDNKIYYEVTQYVQNMFPIYNLLESNIDIKDKCKKE